MRVISCHLENFASYKELDFVFEGQGLTLIQGATGAGKSTLCDAIPWVLFGRTAKDGAVDEVRSWGTEGRTLGEITLEDSEGDLLTIVRTRSPNDLYYVYRDGEDALKNRGKDLNDTQKQINNRVGLDANLYLSGAYFHEFSQTAQFFTTTAKNRRAICEQLVDLTLATKLKDNLSTKQKALVKALDICDSSIRLYQDRLERLAQNDYSDKALTFDEDKEKALRAIAEELVRLQDKVTHESYFNKKRAELQKREAAITAECCETCGQQTGLSDLIPLNHDKQTLRQLEHENRNRLDTIRRLEAQFDAKSAETNLYDALIAKDKIEREKAEKQLNAFAAKQAQAEAELDEISVLLEVAAQFRGAAIRNTIQSLEDATNKLLSEHYDAEIKVTFDVTTADKLDVTIFKDGNACVYTQLSKGQRQLLKLCFGISVMQSVANHHMVNFNCIWFDELTDGLDEQMKVKTFGLLEGLATKYESVFLVEHSESLKSMFHNKFEVTLVNGNSVINAQS